MERRSMLWFYTCKQLHIRLGQISVKRWHKITCSYFPSFLLKAVFLSNVSPKLFKRLPMAGKLNSTDFEPLLAFEENSYGKMWHMCVLNCELDQRCIGFQLCKVTESLFYCETCCRWKKIRGFNFIDDPGCKYIERVSS